MAGETEVLGENPRLTAIVVNLLTERTSDLDTAKWDGKTRL
jgi:hypothetical protein